MPSKDEHLAEAESNEGFFQLLLEKYDNAYAQWAMTAMFYACAHYGRALLAKSSSATITRHKMFSTEFRRKTGSDRLYEYYRRLCDESIRSRYDCVSFTAGEVRGLETTHYIPFRNEVRTLLSQ